MKIVTKDFVPRETVNIKLQPEDSDDLWYAHNLISPGDSVTADTFRKVQRDSESGKKESKRINMKLELQVTDLEYDKDGGALRVRGRNVKDNEHVKIGAYHTLELKIKQKFELTKEVWDSSALDTLKQASDLASSADLAVVLMQEGLASVFLIGRSVTSCRARIETSVPRKHGKRFSSYDSAMKKFFNNVVNACEKHIDFSVVRCVVIASPGFTKDEFHRHLMLEAETRELKPILENKSRILAVHANSGYRHSLGDALSAPNVMNMIKDTIVAKEVGALDRFFKMISKNQYRVCYGPKHVEVSHERMAIQTLLITDVLLKSRDVETRKKYEELVKSVKETGGEAFVFSSMHVSGEQLTQFTGIAAILRFPMPDLDDIEM